MVRRFNTKPGGSRGLAGQLAQSLGTCFIVKLWWLGQAGFAIRFRDQLALIDPYLSDCLAAKYAKTASPHDRMMPSPMQVKELSNVSAVFCTHGHSDHMDPETLPVIAERNPNAVFILPRAEVEHAESLGLPGARLRPMAAGDQLALGVDLTIRAVASAHETLEVNEKGEHRFLGYVFSFSSFSLYHSGDCIPYPGLDDRLRSLGIRVALLPANGRDTRRKALGVPGNFTVQEAFELCERAGIQCLVPHHFGMFAFNTVAVDEIKREASQHPSIELIVPEAGRPLTFCIG